jgi:hypothetical protein
MAQWAYCEQQQLVFSTFAYWPGRLKQLQSGNDSGRKVHFLPVTFKQESTLALALCIINPAMKYSPI